MEDDVDELEEEVVWPCFRFDIIEDEEIETSHLTPLFLGSKTVSKKVF